MNNLLAYIQFHIIKCITALLCHHFITATLSLSLNFNDQIAYILKIDDFHACIYKMRHEWNKISRAPPPPALHYDDGVHMSRTHKIINTPASRPPRAQ